ncbi:MAG: hypothetical protein ACO29L_07580 [Candidatus Methylopumilus sp.]|jgi:hypothetical protein
MKLFFLTWTICAFLFASYASHYKIFGFKSLAKTTGNCVILFSLGIFIFSVSCLTYRAAMIYGWTP